MTPAQSFLNLSQLLTCCQPPEWATPSRLKLTISKETASTRMLRELQEGDFVSTISDSDLQRKFDIQEVVSLPVGTTVEIDIPRSTRSLAIARDVGDLLSIPRAQEVEPVAYIILPEAEPPFLHERGTDRTTLPTSFQRYHQAIDLWGILANHLDHRDEGSGALFFFGTRRIEIFPGFSDHDLERPIEIDAISRFCANPEREELRKEILIAVLSEFLRDHGPESSFSVLLRRSSVFARRLKENLSIYLSTNSPAKLIEEAKEDAIDLSEKLEKIVTAVELKALAVPAAILLATKEIEKGEGVTPLNCLVASSTLLFAITMVYVFRSQKAMLEPLKFTIQEIRGDYIDRGLDEKNGRLDLNFSGLIRRLDWAMSAARAVRLLSFSPLLAVFVAMHLKPRVPSPSLQAASAPARVSQEAPASEKSGLPTSPAQGSDPPALKGSEAGEFTPRQKE